MSESQVDNTSKAVDSSVSRMEAGQNDPNNNDQMRKALDILTGRDVDTNEQPEGEDRADEGKPKDKTKKPLKTISDAAERLGISVDDFYKLELSIADGQDAEKLSVGAVKDEMKNRADFAMDKIRWAEERTEQEGELMRSRNELTELLALIPKTSLTPEIMTKIREKHVATQKIERERIFQVIPEWKVDTKREADLSSMRDHLDKWFPKNYLNNVSDHRTFKYIRDNMLREQRIAQALALVKPKQPKSKQAPSTSGSTTKGPSKPTTQQRGTNAEGQKVAQVKEILRGLTPNI